MSNIYCGNNKFEPTLVDGSRSLGTRYSCLKKGIRTGYAMDVDENFKKPYQPIVVDKKYCGRKTALPDGYSRFGGLHECYQAGVGVGKRKKATSHKPKRKSRRKPKRKSRKSTKKKSR